MTEGHEAWQHHQQHHHQQPPPPHQSHWAHHDPSVPPAVMYSQYDQHPVQTPMQTLQGSVVQAGPPAALGSIPSRRKKPARDPGAPKRNMSAYLLYQNAMREQFKAQNPGMSFGQLSKYTSAMYAQLTPEEKDSWIARAEADKSRYEHELATYIPPPGYDQKGEQIVVVHKVKGSKRSHKDANAPKKNVSAYLLYQNAMRDKFKRDNPGMSFGQLSKYTSHMYKNLSPEEKSAWEQVAQQDKERFEAEMAAYEPPPGHDSRGVLVVDEESFSGGRKRKRPRDPTAPKRNKGSFVLFAEEERPRIKAEFPDIKFTDMGVVLGERWRALSAEDKARFEALANVDKIRFANEMDDYNRLHGVVGDNSSVASSGPNKNNTRPAAQDVNEDHHLPPLSNSMKMELMDDIQHGGEHSHQVLASYGDPSMSMYQNHQQL